VTRTRSAAGQIGRRASILARAAVAAALIAAISVLGWVPQASADKSPGASRFGSCLASQKAGDLLLLFDESSSLQSSDPQAARVTAARNLLQTLGKYADRVTAKLDVAVAGFADTYNREREWAPLTGASVNDVSDSLNTIASKNSGIDTDYWLALDGARQELADRGAGPNGAPRCQAVAWFSDGTIDFTARPVSKPYADGVSLDAPNGIPDTVHKAVDSICRPGGLADQLRSSNIIVLGIGLGANKTPGDFDVMSAISTGVGLQGMKCGNVTTPVPGDFVPVSNLDDMLFAFDSLNPEPGISDKGPVCPKQVCPEARHNFVLDRSIKEVNILGSGGQPGVVPYLVSPSGQTLELPKKDGKIDVSVDGVPVSYEWKSESAQTISLKNTGAPAWVGQWAIVYVDTTGQHPDAVSRVNIHITTDIFPALTGADKVAWRSGQTVNGLTFGLVDGQGKPVPPTELAGTALMSASVVPAGGAPIQLLTSVGKDDIATPVSADLSKVNPGGGVLKMSLVITTAGTADPHGAPIPGTQLSPQEVETPIQIQPKVGLPTLGSKIDFGTAHTAEGATATLTVTGPGCAWIAEADPITVTAGPDGIGGTHLSSPSNAASSCLKVDKGQTAQLSVTLRTDHNGHGGLNGTLGVHVSALDHPDDAQTVSVPFTASLVKPLNTTNFILVLIAALLLGPGIPAALLYLSKWWVSKIPDTPMLAERIPVDVNNDIVERDGEPFIMADTDLVNPVPGLAAGGTRRLPVLGVELSVVLGRSPFGAGHVVADADGRVSVGSQLPGSDKTGLRAVLPLAVHNTWVLLHDPHGPQDHAEVLLLVAGTTDTAARERIYEDIAARLPELLSGLRLRAMQAGVVSDFAAAGATASPFGDGAPAAPGLAQDPFGSAASAPSAGGFATPAATPPPRSTPTSRTSAPSAPAPTGNRFDDDPFAAAPGGAPTPPPTPAPASRPPVAPKLTVRPPNAAPAPDPHEVTQPRVVPPAAATRPPRIARTPDTTPAGEPDENELTMPAPPVRTPFPTPARDEDATGRAPTPPPRPDPGRQDAGRHDAGRPDLRREPPAGRRAPGPPPVNPFGVPARGHISRPDPAPQHRAPAPPPPEPDRPADTPQPPSGAPGFDPEPFDPFGEGN
jgi:hypothetical protein